MLLNTEAIRRERVGSIADPLLGLTGDNDVLFLERTKELRGSRLGMRESLGERSRREIAGRHTSKD